MAQPPQSSAQSRAPAFPRLVPSVTSSDPRFRENQAAWTRVLDRYQETLEAAFSEGSSSSIDVHASRGRLLARDRVSLLLDEDTPFLELGIFAGSGLEDSTPAASLICGVGVVNGVKCMVFAHVPTINGGSWNEFTETNLTIDSYYSKVLKQNRITQIATENNLPIIALVQSAGVYLPKQFRVFHKGGQIFRDLARRSKNGIPTCAVVFGSSVAGGAYHPALSDYTIFVKEQAQVFLGGPALVKMATGEVADPETLGGAEMHATITGLADQFATDEFDAIRKAREWIRTTTAAQSPLLNVSSVAARPPRYDKEEILGLIDPDIRKPMDMQDIILRIVDDSRMELFKPAYGTGMITGWSHIHGHLVGIVANQRPVILPQESDKATHFIRLCNQGKTPIIFLHNVTGFMVGVKTETAGLIKKGAQLVSAVSTSTVPHIGVICGASYGAGNYAMSGRAFDPRFLWSWPSARCSVMGPDQLGGVMDTISAASKNGGASKANNVSEKIRQDAHQQSEAYWTSAHILDDGIIDPRDTRDVLGMCLEIVKGRPIEGNPGFRGLARI